MTTEAVYYAIPQNPPVAGGNCQPIVLRDDFEATEIEAETNLPNIDARIRWIHFALGCATLLPWNGACFDLDVVPTDLTRHAMQQ